jgi:hypothetical protein
MPWFVCRRRGVYCVAMITTAAIAITIDRMRDDALPGKAHFAVAEAWHAITRTIYAMRHERRLRSATGFQCACAEGCGPRECVFPAEASGNAALTPGRDIVRRRKWDLSGSAHFRRRRHPNHTQ